MALDRIVYETDGSLEIFHSGVRRANFSRHHTVIRSVADLKATLRAGPYAWPGRYPLYFLASDGAALSFESVRANFRETARAIWDRLPNDGWRVGACEINYEDTDLYCAHSGARIPAAYGDEEAGE